MGVASFNGAATLSLRKPLRCLPNLVRVALLQWGRNFIVAETRSPPTTTGYCSGFNGAATLSLRKRQPPRHTPTPTSSFNGAATLSLRKLWGGPGQRGSIPASMGPQLYRCGNLYTLITGLDTFLLLQWGRNFIVAETGKRQRRGGVGHHASMGPQLYRCGNGIRMVPAQDIEVCFNGAATLSLRKLPNPNYPYSNL